MISIGIDLGGTNIKLGLLQGNQIIATSKIKASAHESMAARLPEIKSAVDQMLKEEKIDRKLLIGIGLAFPSVVDHLNKKILSRYVKFTDAVEINFEAWSQTSWGIPMTLENDARAALVGEWQFGAGRNINNIVMLTLGTGVGSGVLLDGQLVRGAHFVGGNLGGHTIINMNGDDCNCGSRGCVETEASGWVLHTKYKTHKYYAESKLAKSDEITYAKVFDQANDTDKLATIIRDHSVKAWSVNALNFVHNFDPEIIIVGGGIMKSGDLIIPSMQALIDKNSWLPSGTVKVVAAQQSDYAGVLGVGYLAQQV